jgi:hypothetical protein
LLNEALSPCHHSVESSKHVIPKLERNGLFLNTSRFDSVLDGVNPDRQVSVEYYSVFSSEELPQRRQHIDKSFLEVGTQQNGFELTF